MFSLLRTLIVIIFTFLYLADSKLISYPTQSSLISYNFAILFDLNLPVIQINRPSRSVRKISPIDKPMCVNSVFHQLNNSISSDLSTLFDYFGIISLSLINRTYSKFSWFNTELIKLRQILRRLQRKYASSKFESDLISFKVFDRFTIKNFSLPNRHTLLICSVVMKYLLNKLINYLSP